MVRIDPSRQVSMVGSSKRIRYWGKRPNIPQKGEKNVKHRNFIFTHPADFILNIKNTQFPIEMAS